MRILHVIPGLAWERGGPSAVVHALARAQVEAGHQVAVLTTDQGVRRGQRPVDLGEGVTVDRLKVVGTDRLAYAPGFARVARERLRASDVVHVHSIFTNPVHVALREARAAGVPVVLRPCGLLHQYSLRHSRWPKWFYLRVWGRMVRRACTAWHYTSEDESFASWPWDQSPRFVLPNGIEPDEFAVDRGQARAAVRQALPELGDSPYVLFLGRLHPKKRLDLLVQAFLAGAPSHFKLVVAGPDDYGLWDAVAARLLLNPPAAERVQRVGTVTGREKVNLLAGASLFALPSEHENFGIAALEALAAGTPVLLSPHVDLALAVVADHQGYTAPLEAEAWRERLAEVLADLPALEKMAEPSRRWVREHYAWDQLARELVQQYRWVMDGCPAAAPAAAGGTV
jgi:glycosyltransferase involved in cell wall biosynthesis